VLLDQSLIGDMNVDDDVGTACPLGGVERP
jgi:hypothetical protein